MMDTARVTEVIETTILRRGKGTIESPVRIVTQYWSREGELLAENDPCLIHELLAEREKSHE